MKKMAVKNNCKKDVVVKIDENWYNSHVNKSLWCVPNNIGNPRENIGYVYVVVNKKIVACAEFISSRREKGRYINIKGNPCDTDYIWEISGIKYASSKVEADGLLRYCAKGMRYINGTCSYIMQKLSATNWI